MIEKKPLSEMTLPAKYYTDPQYFLEERERFFGKNWVCVGHADQIPNPGDFFLREVAGDSLIVTRDTAGKINAFFNVCRHRGTRLCEKDQGCFEGRIQCPYHAWTYNLEGKLVGAPHFSEVPGFETKDYPLNAAKCELWEGMIFVHFSPNAPALSSQLGDLTMKFRPWRCEDLRLGKRIEYEVHGNWKLIIQNYSECLHCPVIHPGLKKLSHYMTGENEAANSRYLGGHMTLNEGVETMSVTGKSDWAPLPDLSEAERRRVYYYWISPNLLLSAHPDYVMTHTLWPIRENLTRVICEWHFHKSEVSKTGFSPEGAVRFWDEVNREDWHVSELSQLGIASRAYTPGPYSLREGLLHGLDQILVGRL